MSNSSTVRPLLIVTIGLLLAAILSFPGLSYGSQRPALLISDIDDTLKQSNMKSAIPYRALGKKEFYGLSALYSQWLQSSGFESEVVYITAAPGLLQKLGRWFLNERGYPLGEFFGRESIFDSKVRFKTQAIARVVEQYPDHDVVLVGDNGEEDTVVFSNISRRYGEARIVTSFIHQIYDRRHGGSALKQGQLGWLTSADLALNWWLQGRVDKNVASEFVSLVTSRLPGSEKQREEILPDWVSCGDFWRSYTPVSADDPEMQDQISDLEGMFGLLCS